MDSCHIADQMCKAPANLEPLIKVSSTCFSCGNYVCCNCSSKRKYLNNGSVRLCNDCQIELDGNDTRVMERLTNLVNGKKNRTPRRI